MDFFGKVMSLLFNKLSRLVINFLLRKKRLLILCAWDILKEVTINPTTELPELTQDWGNRPWEGTDRNLCTLEPRRKEQ